MDFLEAKFVAAYSRTQRQGLRAQLLGQGVPAPAVGPMVDKLISDVACYAAADLRIRYPQDLRNVLADRRHWDPEFEPWPWRGPLAARATQAIDEAARAALVRLTVEDILEYMGSSRLIVAQYPRTVWRWIDG